MQSEELSRMQRAIQLATAGYKEEAYPIFIDLVRANPLDANLLLWIVFTSPSINEAKGALSQVSTLDPLNPNLESARLWLTQNELPPPTPLVTPSTKKWLLPGLIAFVIILLLVISGIVLLLPGTNTGSINTNVAVSPLKPTVSDSKLDQLTTANKNNEWDTVIELGEQLLKDDPSNLFIQLTTASAYTERGVQNYHLGKYAQALSDHNRAIALKPKNPRSYVGRGNVYLVQLNSQKALEEFKMAAQLDPTYVNAFYNQGIIYAQMQDYQQALVQYNRALELDPYYAAALNNRAGVYLYLKEYQKALDDYNRALAVGPFMQAYWGRGSAYGNLNQYDLAIADYTKALQLDPSAAEIYYDRAYIYTLKGNIAAAKLDYQKAAELGYADAVHQLQLLQNIK